MRPRIVTVLASTALGATLLVPGPWGSAPSAGAAECVPSQDSSATPDAPTVDVDVTRSTSRVVRRSGGRVTAEAVVAVRAQIDVTAGGTATVDTCPDGVSTPVTRTATRSGTAEESGSATKRATRSGAAAAKKAATGAARKAATAQAAPAAYQRAADAAVSAASAAALAAAQSAAGGGGGPQTERWSVGYYAGYETADYPVSAIDWAGLTDVAVAFYLPSNAGVLDGSLFQGTGAQGAALARSITGAAHAHGVRALASIGGADSRPALLAAMTGHRATLVEQLVALRDLGYDGIDIDWEPAEATDLPLIAQLGTAVRQAWPGAVLTSTFYSVNDNFVPDLSGMAGVAQVYDFVSVQTYGMAGAYEGWRSWHSSALAGATSSTPSSVTTSARAYLDAGVPASKLGVGIGAYGLCYTAPVSAPGQELNGSRIAKVDYDLQFRDIRTVYQPAMTRHFDSTAKVPYLSGSKNGCSYIAYEDEQSVAAKLAYLDAEGLAGVITWTINQQYLPSAAEKNPLLGTIADWLG